VHNWYGSSGTFAPEPSACSTWYVAGRPSLEKDEKIARGKRLADLRGALAVSQDTLARMSKVFPRTEVNRMERGGYAFTSSRQIEGIARATGLTESETRDYILGHLALEAVRPKLKPPADLVRKADRPWWMDEKLRHQGVTSALAALEEAGAEQDFLRALIRHVNESPKDRSPKEWMRYASGYLPGWQERARKGETIESWSRQKKGVRVDRSVMVAIQSAYAPGETPFRPWPDVVARYQRIYRNLRAHVTPLLRDKITPLEIAQAAAPFLSDVA
jgi:transcriptional regulator with XRE-family HTH domain